MPIPKPSRILVTRRDNIGDLICTTPLLAGLRTAFPDALIAVLASSYNVEVIRGNTDVDEVFVFPKRAGKGSPWNYLLLICRRLELLLKVRLRRFDVIILANGGCGYARQLGGKTLLGFRDVFYPENPQPDVIVDLENRLAMHEVNKLERLAGELGIVEEAGPLRLKANPDAVANVRHDLEGRGWKKGRKTVGVHISSRRPKQRWPAAYFASLIRQLHAGNQDLQFILLWSPGAADAAMHPGDDSTAETILSACAGLPLFAAPTDSVTGLIAACTFCDQFIGSDGGAMHVAAALGKPVLCFFGDSQAAEWFPWGVPYVLLQPPSRIVADISVEEAVRGFQALQDESWPAGPKRR